MIECNAIIEANKEIDELKRINKKLNKVCIDYSFKMEKLEKENKELKQQNEFLKRICNEDYRNLRRAYRMATKKR